MSVYDFTPVRSRNGMLQRTSRLSIAALIAGGLVFGPIDARGQGMPPGIADPHHHSEMSPEVKQSVGCLISGTVATIGSLALGGENLVNLIAGGVVLPQNRAVLYVGIVGVVFASFCALGQAVTPLYLYYTDTPDPAPAVKPIRVTTAQRPHDIQSGILAGAATRSAQRLTTAGTGVTNPASVSATMAAARRP